MLAFMKKFENLMIQALMVMMALVLALATVDLGWLVVSDLREQPISCSVWSSFWTSSACSCWY
jgi:hypothetical protein